MLKIAVIGIPGGWSSEKLTQAIETKTGSCQLLDCSKLTLNLENRTVYYNDAKLNQLDGLVLKKLGTTYAPFFLDRLEILRFLKTEGVKIYSDPDHIYRAINRLSCTTILRQGDIPIPPTVITEDVDQAMETVSRFGKAIFKPLYTSKARGMTVLEPNHSLRSDIETYVEHGNPVMYIQKFIPIAEKDLGLIFLGGNYIATYARVRTEGSWTTSTVFGGKYEPHTPPDSLIELGYKAQALFQLDFTCVDIVETQEGPKVFEVSAFGGFRGLEESAGIDFAEQVAQYIVGKINHEA